MSDATSQAVDAARRWLSIADRLLPSRIAALYLVGSVALGAYQPGRSDIDFVALLTDDEPSRLRRVHLAAMAGAAQRVLRARRSPLSGTLNGVYVAERDVTRPVTEIAPIASHHRKAFQRGRAFDVNPVVWTVLAQRGIVVRGPDPSSLGLDPEPDRLREWNLANLRSYWAPWGERSLATRTLQWRLRPEWCMTWGALGPPRLHATIAMGTVLSKEEAGAYALDVFEPRWHPLLRAALAWRRGDRPAPVPEARVTTARFVLHVVSSAEAMAAEPTRPGSLGDCP